MIFSSRPSTAPQGNFLGQAATRCFPALTNNASYTFGMGRSAHVAREKLINPTVVYGNFYMTGSGEHAPLGGAGTLKVALEYPAGVFTLANECVAAGNTGVPFPAGNLALTFNVVVPKGARFWLRPYQVNAAGTLWTQVAGGTSTAQPSDEGYEIGTGANDKTTSGSVNFGNGIAFFPLVIATQKHSPSVLIIGDSREAGGVGGNFLDASSDVGPAARIIGPRYGYTQFAMSATLQSGWNSGSHTYLNQLIAAGYWTHVVNCYGVNDAGGGASGSTIATARATCAAALKAANSNLVIIGATLYPYVSSSDVFVTKANQSQGANATRCLTFNDFARLGIAGEDYCWDEADGIDVNREGRYPVSKDPSAASRTPCAFTGAISGTTLTVSAIASGSINLGDYLYDAGGNIKDTTYIVEQLTGTAGSTGTYRVNLNYSGSYPFPSAVTSESMSTAGMITRDGLHAQYAGEELIVRRAGSQLLELLAA